MKKFDEFFKINEEEVATTANPDRATAKPPTTAKPDPATAKPAPAPAKPVPAPAKPVPPAAPTEPEKSSTSGATQAQPDAIKTVLDLLNTPYVDFVKKLTGKEAPPSGEDLTADIDPKVTAKFWFVY